MQFLIFLVGEGVIDLTSEPSLLLPSLSSVEGCGDRRLRDEVVDFRSWDKDSGQPLTKHGCAYMSVSGPLRTLAKPYWRQRK
mmetsp:Transcript_31957/g.77556  ORF Transcript_31957/g.77556 Transcript_31957/m.77556 type:complete len:82 (+) Transcript_31957:4388-4633(+)